MSLLVFKSEQAEIESFFVMMTLKLFFFFSPSLLELIIMTTPNSLPQPRLPCTHVLLSTAAPPRRLIFLCGIYTAEQPILSFLCARPVFRGVVIDYSWKHGF